MSVSYSPPLLKKLSNDYSLLRLEREDSVIDLPILDYTGKLGAYNPWEFLEASLRAVFTLESEEPLYVFETLDFINAALAGSIAEYLTGKGVDLVDWTHTATF